MYLQISFKNRGGLRNDQGIDACWNKCTDAVLEEKTNAEVHNDFEKIYQTCHLFARPELLASDVGYQLVSKVKHEGC